MRLRRSRVVLALGLLAVAVAGTVGGLLLGRSASPPATSQRPPLGEAIPLPPPRTDGPVSVEAALASRRSVRAYRLEPLSLAEVAQLLWAAQGITDPRGYRAAPSAGALYPLELYLVCGRVDGLEPGIYRYDPEAHTLGMVAPGDARDDLARAALDQSPVRDAAIDLVFTTVYERTTGKYGDRGHRYVHMEAGHAAQNVYLQSTAMDLGTVAVGAFEDAAVQRLLRLPEDETPLYIMPVGRPADGG
jgi:SagB-type dehydrogenase family enzyme